MKGIMSMIKNVIFAGWYGTGKTEFCLNYAISLSKTVKERVNIADLDIINPYFRSREKVKMLNEYNIRVLGDSLKNNIGQDLPAVSSNVLEPMIKGEFLIFDLAGSINGFKALSFIRDMLIEKGYKLFVVINAFREESNKAEKIIAFIRSIEKETIFRVYGLVNNSHLLYDTTEEHILYGQEIALKVSSELNIPLEYTCVRYDIYDKISSKIKSINTITFDKLIMRESWQ